MNGIPRKDKGGHIASPQEEAIERAKAGYVYADLNDEAIDSLEMSARFLEEAETDPRRWKWVVIALYTAIQNFMVLVLKNSWDVATQHRDVRNEKLEAHHNLYKAIESGDETAIEEARAKDRDLIFKKKLDGFDWLYERIKDKDHWAMGYLGNDKVFEPGATTDDSMATLKDKRDDYMHFQYGCRFHAVSTLALIAVDGLSVIEFLMNRDRLIGWQPDSGHKRRAEAAYDAATITASRLADKHPVPPMDESERQAVISSFRQMMERAVEDLRNEDAVGDPKVTYTECG